VVATLNPFRFSTKFQDRETDLLNYGFRDYQPGVGKWSSRDPSEENGSVNLYGFVANTPINLIDLAGLQMSGGYGTMPLPLFPNVPPGNINPFSDAVSAYIEGFITLDPIQKKLFAHYREKTGTPLKLTRDELKKMNPSPMTITSTKEFQAIDRHATGTFAVTDWKFHSWTAMPLTLNEFTVHLNGSLDICSPPFSAVEFQGKMTISDTYNFDLKGFLNSESGRSFSGELKTWLVHYFAGGKGYPVSMDPIDFTEKIPPVSLSGQW
jgi:RHS repeat-associated protein